MGQKTVECWKCNGTGTVSGGVYNDSGVIRAGSSCCPDCDGDGTRTVSEKSVPT
jgi:DnaJ-class molecular chaperone